MPELGRDSGELARLAGALEALGLSVRRDVPAARLGFWRIGGPVDLFVQVDTGAQLAEIMGLGAKVNVVGNGSNLLVADAGMRGITVRLGGSLKESSMDPETGLLVAGAGLLNTVLQRRMERMGLAALGSLAGVPGTLGGAICMNAGTSLGWIGDVTERVQVVLPSGVLTSLSADQLGFRYRHAELPPGAVLTRVWLRVEPDPDGLKSAEVRALLDRRKQTQPLDRPSCGSVFKNPEGDYAGRLIEEAGLKGHRQGGAQISEKHANFIVNHGGATAEEVYALITLARDTVARRSGVVLEPEVHPAGAWEPGRWPLPAPPASEGPAQAGD